MPGRLITNKHEATDQLRILLTELRAINNPQTVELLSVLSSAISRMRVLAHWLENGGDYPDATAAIKEASTLLVGNESNKSDD